MQSGIASSGKKTKVKIAPFKKATDVSNDNNQPKETLDKSGEDKDSVSKALEQALGNAKASIKSI